MSKANEVLEVLRISTPGANLPTMRILAFHGLPALPKPSKKLESILLKFNKHTNRLIIGKEPCRAPRKRKSTQKRRINGFIAFRAFYSRSIRDPAVQKQLSTMLGKVWGAEPNQHVWDCYALRYNETGGQEEFMTWLMQNLKSKKPCQSTTVIRRRISKNIQFKNVEDVYLE